jgi:hypothetical protein
MSGITGVCAEHGDAILARRTDVNSALANGELLLTLKEAAAACRTSPRTWRTWDALGKVPAPIRIGRMKFWRPRELEDWVATGCPARKYWIWEPRTD